ncbi:hypothetical protein McpSp1_13230 [Methanocorpusculaceae archaeon Sp1]|nr:hypothetical protein [Methanocorpusculaceae archaeon Sp1]
MTYRLHAVTIRTDNSAQGMERISELWQDIVSGKLPLLFDSDHTMPAGISPVSRYSNYASDETGEYDLTVITVTAEFFAEMDEKVEKGLYKKYDASDEGGDVGLCAKKAWGMVWSDKKTGTIRRSFTEDFESTVPAAYTKDGKAHCYLYIAVE